MHIHKHLGASTPCLHESSVISVESNSVTLWAVALQTPQSMEFSLQVYWSGLPFPSPVDLPYLGAKSMSPVSPTLQVGSLLLSHLGSHQLLKMYINSTGVLKELKAGSWFPLFPKILHSPADCPMGNISGKKSEDIMCYFFKICLCPNFSTVVTNVSVLFQSNLLMSLAWRCVWAGAFLYCPAWAGWGAPGRNPWAVVAGGSWGAWSGAWRWGARDVSILEWWPQEFLHYSVPLKCKNQSIDKIKLLLHDRTYLN